MGVVSGLLVFVIIWWVALFVVLPWGGRPPEMPEPGMADSAPARPNLPLKFAVTTALALAIWLVVYVIVATGVISFHDMAKSMGSG
jgi:predicted secreted protein